MMNALELREKGYQILVSHLVEKLMAFLGIVALTMSKVLNKPDCINNSQGID